MKNLLLIALLIFAYGSNAQGQERKATPTERFAVNPGFRDWAPTVLAGTTIIGGNSSNRGGLFAVDTASGKLKWTARPTGTQSGNPFVATRPAVAGNIVVVPMGNTLMGLSLATGRETWRGINTALGASVATDDGSVYVLGEDSNFYSFDAATADKNGTSHLLAALGCIRFRLCREGLVVRDGAAS